MSYLSIQGKSYTSNKEFNMRQQIWRENDAFIKSYNANSKKNKTAVLAHNKFSVLNQAEKAKMLGKLGALPPLDLKTL